jgi:hypothetical protein
MPDLVRSQLRDGPHAGEPTTGRGEIERLARACQAAHCHAGLDWTVVETRFNVVRSSVPDLVTTARKLRDYLPPLDQREPPTTADAPGAFRHTALGRLLDGTLRFDWRGGSMGTASVPADEGVWEGRGVGDSDP